MWKAYYFEALKELANANKGAARLRRKLDRLQKRTSAPQEAAK